MSLRRQKKFAEAELEQIQQHEAAIPDEHRVDGYRSENYVGGAQVCKTLCGEDTRYTLSFPGQNTEASRWEKDVLVPARLEPLIEPLLSAFCIVSLTHTSATRLNRLKAVVALIEYWRRFPPDALSPAALTASHGGAFIESLRTQPGPSGRPRARSTIRQMLGDIRRLIDVADAPPNNPYNLRINTRRYTKDNARTISPAPAIDELTFFRIRQAAREVITEFRESFAHDQSRPAVWEPELELTNMGQTAKSPSQRGELYNALEVVKSNFPNFPYEQPTAAEMQEIFGDKYLRLVRLHRHGRPQPKELSKRITGKEHDLTNGIKPGMVIGAWTVLSETRHSKFRGVYWKCRCKCGLLKTIPTQEFTSKGRRGCRKCSAKNRQSVSSYGLFSALIGLCAPTRLVMTAYLVLIYMELGRLNPETFLNLTLSDIRKSSGKSWQDYLSTEPSPAAGADVISIVGTKLRASSPQVAVLNSLRETDSHSFGGYTLLSEWLNVTAPMRAVSPESFKNLLWIYIGLTNSARSRHAVTPAFFGERNTDLGVKHNIVEGLKDLFDIAFPNATNRPRGMNLRGIRNYMAQLVFRITGGDVKAAQNYLGHAFRSTTEHYLNQTLLRQSARIRMGRTLHRVSARVLHGAAYHHDDDPRFINPKDFTVESLRNAATPGYSCIDNLSSPIQSQKPGVPCTAVGACYACPNKYLNPDSPQAYAHLLEAKALLGSLSPTSFYATSLLFHVEADIERFDPDAKLAAEHFNLRGRQLPRTYFE